MMSECRDLMVIDQPPPVSLTMQDMFDITKKPVLIADGHTVYEVLADNGYCRWDDEKMKYVRVTPFVVSINGDWVLEEHGGWLYVIKPGDIIRIERLAAGGKGGGGSKGLGIIVAIVAIVAAPFTGGASLYLLAVSAAMLMTGMAGVPKQTPTALSGKDGASPTYSLSPMGNQGRLLSAIPKLYGKLRYTPDLAAQPYTEYAGNEQYLYELFALSCGEVELHTIYVDETPLSQFDDVETQLIPPFGQVTLFPDNVVTSPSVDNIALKNNVIAGPYIVGAPGTLSTAVAFDFAFPGGCYQVDAQGATRSVGVEIKVYSNQVDDAGNVIGPDVALGGTILNYATQTPQRVSFKIPTRIVGRHQYWVTRAGPDNSTDNKIQNQINWVGLKAYLKADPGVNYGNVTLLAVKMKASEVLNSQTVRKFTVLATGKCPSWSPIAGFSQPVANNSIAWAAADILHNASYGKGMAASRIDMAELFRLHQVWLGRGDTFNALFDTTISLWEALTKVLRAGRAAPMNYAGRVEFIREEPQSLPVQMFSPKNIVAGSFSVQHNWPTRSTPDYVTIQYRDNQTWTTKEVDCILPNMLANKAATVELFGVDNRPQAYREGMFLAASNRLRRRTIRFSTEMEGQIIRYNDLISVSHDVADWGFSGVVLSFDRASGRIRTSEPLPFLATTCVIGFRRKDGSYDGPYRIAIDPTTDDMNDVFGGIVQGTLAQRNAIYISPGIHSDRTMYQFGPSNKAGVKALVTKVSPKGNDLYNIECINYVEYIYFAESGGVMPFPESPSNLVKPPVGPIVDRITVQDTATPGQQAVQITPAVGAQYYEYQFKTGEGLWANLVNATPRTAILINLPMGDQVVRARGVGTAVPGPWVTWFGEVHGSVLSLPKLKSLRTTPRIMAIDIDWEFDDDTKITGAFTTIVVSTSPIPGPANSKILGEFPLPVTHTEFKTDQPAEKYYFFAMVTDHDGRQGPWYNDFTAIPGQSTDDPSAILKMLEGRIDDSYLTKALRDTIGSLVASNEGLQTAVNVITEQMTDDREAVARYVVQIEAQIDANNTAITQIVQQVQADINGQLSAMIMMRAQLRADGRLITAGIGIGITPDPSDPTQHNSEIILQAGRIAFTTNALDDPTVAPLVIQGSSVFMHGAFIANLTVGYAQIMDAAIGSAKIQDLSVQTIKVAGEAITIPRYTDNGGPVYGAGVGNAIKILELIFTTDAYSGALMTFGSSFQSNGTQQYSYWMVLDGVQLCRSDANWSDSSIGLTAGRYINAGQHTLQVFFSGSPAALVYYSNLVMQAAKR